MCRFFMRNFLLNLARLCANVISIAVYLICSFLQILSNVNMSGLSRKRKRHTNTDSNQTQTVVQRGLINANWQKFLTNYVIMDKKTEKQQPQQNNHYTGSFRRDRKKKNKQFEVSNTVENNLKTLNINNKNIENNLSNSPDVRSREIIDSDNLGQNKKNNSEPNKITKFIAMDCEMVGIGFDGSDHMLARISLVNKFGDCIYDKFVKPREEVKDYRTEVSGVRKEDLINGEEFVKVQKEVADILKGKILVGHSLKNDLSVLFLSHPKKNIRDTSKYKPFKKITKGSTPSLKRLAKEILNIDIQHGEHSSVEDAKAAMKLYCTVAKKWELMMSQKRGHNSKLVEDML